MEDTGHAAEYDEFEDDDVSARDYAQTAVDWVDASVSTTAQKSGADQRIPDISALVRAAVTHQDWEAGNSMAFMLGGQGTRTAESYNGGGSDRLPSSSSPTSWPRTSPRRVSAGPSSTSR